MLTAVWLAVLDQADEEHNSCHAQVLLLSLVLHCWPFLYSTCMLCHVQKATAVCLAVLDYADEEHNSWHAQALLPPLILHSWPFLRRMCM